MTKPLTKWEELKSLSGNELTKVISHIEKLPNPEALILVKYVITATIGALSVDIGRLLLTEPQLATTYVAILSRTASDANKETFDIFVEETS